MNPYLEPTGFLGTGASLLADLTLIAYLLLIIPAMLIGFWFARRGKHRPQHQWLMIGVTVVNWVLIIFLMVAAYRFDVIDNIADQPGNARYLLPTIHGILGLPAQLLATFIVIRMAIEDRNVAAAKRRGETNLRQYWFLRAKPFMQVTLALWLATATLGVASYVIRYNVIGGGAANGDNLPLVATEAVESTPEAVDDSALVATLEVVATPEIIETPEVEDDDDDNSGRGSGDDNDNADDDNSGRGSNGNSNSNDDDDD